MDSNARTDFESCYIVISGTLKQSKLDFDKTINLMKNSLKQLIERPNYEIFYLNRNYRAL